MAGGTNAVTQLFGQEEPEADASRAAILDGALAAFVDVGVRRTSMGDVARRSRISPATLYRKFTGKSGLVEAVALREARRFVADMADLLEDVRRSGGDAEEQIVELALAVIDHLQRNKLLRRLLQTEPELVLPVLTTGGAPVLALGRDYLTGVLRDFQADGLMPDFDPVPMAEVLARLSLSFALTPDTALPLDDQEATRAILRAHIVPALGLPAGPRPTTRRSR
jgi:AcrR family transcriptional regulator